MSAVFRRGDLRLFLLGALEDGPQHGYELMRVLEDRFAGLYRPSAGSIYPRLNSLVASGLLSRDGRDYALTPAGRAELEARRADYDALTSRVAVGPRRAGHALRNEVRAAAAEVRAQQRQVNRQRRTRSAQGADALASLRVELRVFAADVLAAARRADLDRAGVSRVLGQLDDARRKVLTALAD